MHLGLRGGYLPSLEATNLALNTPRNHPGSNVCPCASLAIMLSISCPAIGCFPDRTFGHVVIQNCTADLSDERRYSLELTAALQLKQQRFLASSVPSSCHNLLTEQAGGGRSTVVHFRSVSREYTYTTCQAECRPVCWAALYSTLCLLN